MTFDVQEYRQFIELLYRHPEWRAEVRQLVLSEDILSLLQTMKELAEAQKRTDRKVNTLAGEVGRLSERVGSTVEEEAESVLWAVMSQKGYRFVSGAVNLRWDSKEVDVVMRVEDAIGRAWTVVVEAKVRLGREDVHRWAKRAASAGFRRALEKQGFAGPYLVHAYAMRPDAGARQADREQGIGLMNADGEVVPLATTGE